MEAILADVLAGAPERVIFCEHEAVLTVGSSGDMADIGADAGVPVVETGRGGKVTYHGPGQRVVYLVINLNRWNKDVRAYVKWLQQWLIATACELGVAAEAGDKNEIGVWVGNRKIAAIGVRVRKGMAYHGIALNVANDMGIYKRFVPCGITDKGVARLADMGVDDMDVVDEALKRTLAEMIPENE